MYKICYLRKFIFFKYNDSCWAIVSVLPPSLGGGEVRKPVRPWRTTFTLRHALCPHGMTSLWITRSLVALLNEKSSDLGKWMSYGVAETNLQLNIKRGGGLRWLIANLKDISTSKWARWIKPLSWICFSAGSALGPFWISSHNTISTPQPSNKPTVHVPSYVLGSGKHPTHILTVTAGQVRRQLMELRPGKAADPDSISPLLPSCLASWCKVSVKDQAVKEGRHRLKSKII